MAIHRQFIMRHQSPIIIRRLFTIMPRRVITTMNQQFHLAILMMDSEVTAEAGATRNMKSMSMAVGVTKVVVAAVGIMTVTVMNAVIGTNLKFGF